jgi:hypothetical protein
MAGNDIMLPRRHRQLRNPAHVLTALLVKWVTAEDVQLSVVADPVVILVRVTRVAHGVFRYLRLEEARLPR